MSAIGQRLKNPIRKIKRRGLSWLAAELRQVETSGTGMIENIAGKKTYIQVGAHTYVRGRLLTYGHGGQITIGEWSYVGVRTEIWSMESISIGSRVLISHNVNIMDGSGHSKNASERHAHFRAIIEKGHPDKIQDLPGVTSAPIIIEDDVWISFGVTILQGVRIGAGSVIAAGSLVAHDVPPGVLYRCEVTPIITPLEIDASHG
jgi:acetyltransferase-like isoleucine patch superfamily enzyme